MTNRPCGLAAVSTTNRLVLNPSNQSFHDEQSVRRRARAADSETPTHRHLEYDLISSYEDEKMRI